MKKLEVVRFLAFVIGFAGFAGIPNCRAENPNPAPKLGCVFSGNKIVTIKDNAPAQDIVPGQNFGYFVQKMEFAYGRNYQLHVKEPLAENYEAVLNAMYFGNNPNATYLTFDMRLQKIDPKTKQVTVFAQAYSDVHEGKKNESDAHPESLEFVSASINGSSEKDYDAHSKLTEMLKKGIYSEGMVTGVHVFCKVLAPTSQDVLPGTPSPQQQ